jgi:hypothetical protein
MVPPILSPTNRFRFTPAAALLLVSMTVTTVASAQGKLVDRRDQAEGWYVPLHGHVTIEGNGADGVEATLYKDNTEVGKFPVKKNGAFELNLDIDQFFTIMVKKEGYQTKMIYVDTTLPQDLVTYPDYECFVNLMPKEAKHIETFYTDFPSAIIRYDAEMKGFYHSENYLTHIQTKLSGFASAEF